MSLGLFQLIEDMQTEHVSSLFYFHNMVLYRLFPISVYSHRQQHTALGSVDQMDNNLKSLFRLRTINFGKIRAKYADDGNLHHNRFVLRTFYGVYLYCKTE